VVSAKETSSPYPQDEEYAKLLSCKIQKIEIDYKRKSQVRNALNIITFGILNTPDDKNWWAIKAFFKLRKNVYKYKNLLTISKYDSSHITGLLIKRINPNIKWTAYFSDPWTENTFNKRNAFLEGLNNWLEKLVITKADHLVYVNEETRQKTMEKYSGNLDKKSLVIPHSFEKSLYPKTKDNNSVFTVRYLGNFYPERNPKSFFEVLGRLKAEGLLSSNNFIFEFYGAPFKNTEKWLDDNNIQDIAFYKGQVGYLKSLELMKNSDLLLVIDAPAETNIFLTSKIVDYLGSLTPIFAITPSQGATAEFIKQAGGYQASPDDLENIKNNLVQILSDKPSSWSENRFYESFESENIAQQYLPLFNRKIKILHAIGGLGTGGKEKQLTEIIKNLSDKDFEQYLFTKNTNSYYYEQILPHIKKTFLPAKDKFSVLDIFKAWKIINEIKPDVVNSWSTTTSHIFFLIKAFTPFNFGLINASIRSAQIKLDFGNKMEAFLYNLYPVVVSNSTAGLKTFRQLHKKGRYVLPNGFDFNKVPNEPLLQEKINLGFPENKFIITMVGRLDEQKDHNAFIDIAYHCSQKEPGKYAFYIVGSGPYKKQIERTIEDKKLTSCIHLLGERNDVENILRGSDLSILVSSDKVGEGVSNAILESLAVGTPVLADSNPGNEELLSGKLSYCLVKPKKPEIYYEKIVQLRKDAKFRVEISEKGKELVKENFNISSTLEKFKDIIEFSL
jgi:glycosyltransferase involved in cell wall biosynthesis